MSVTPRRPAKPYKLSAKKRARIAKSLRSMLDLRRRYGGRLA